MKNLIIFILIVELLILPSLSSLCISNNDNSKFENNTEIERSRQLENNPWPISGHDTRHTGLSLSDTSDNPGQLRWKFESGGWATPPVIGSGEIIYFGSTNNFTYALNPDGTLNWKFDLGKSNGVSSPAISADGTIYISSNGVDSTPSFIYAINLNGSLKWKFDLGIGFGTTSPSVGSDGTIYIGSCYNWASYIHAINPNGTMKWKFNIKEGLVGISSPAIGTDGTIYIGTLNEYIYAINMNGTLRWRFKNEDWSFLSSPAIGSDGTIYFGSDNNFTIAINPNGTLKWKLETGTNFCSSPAIGSDGTIYISSDENFTIALNLDSTLKWKFETGKKYGGSSPAIGSDGTIFIGDSNFIYAINSNGSLKWKFETGSYVSSPAIGSDGTIYIGSDSLYSIGKPPSRPTPPENLFATVGDGFVELFWEIPEYNGEMTITRYNIYRETDIGEKHLLDYVTHEKLLYRDVTVTNGHTYFYYVTAMNVVGESNSSNEVNATPHISLNNAPKANFTSEPDRSLKIGDEIFVNASQSYDPDSDNLTYIWDWGDLSENSFGVVTNHRYKKTGSYVISLTVRDTYDNEDTSTKQVYIHERTTGYFLWYFMPIIFTLFCILIGYYLIYKKKKKYTAPKKKRGITGRKSKRAKRL